MYILWFLSITKHIIKKEAAKYFEKAADHGNSNAMLKYSSQQKWSSKIQVCYFMVME